MCDLVMNGNDRYCPALEARGTGIPGRFLSRWKMMKRLTKTFAELDAMLAAELEAMDGVCATVTAKAARCRYVGNQDCNWVVDIAPCLHHEDCNVAMEHFGEMLRAKYNLPTVAVGVNLL